jgi:ankyrin repeat protein
VIELEGNEYAVVQSAVLKLDVDTVRSEIAGLSVSEAKRFVNAKEILESNGGFTLLHLASMSTREGSAAELVDTLVRAGVDVSVKTKSGVTALDFLSAKGDSASVQILLDAGADASCVDANGFTPLMYAASGSRDEEVCSRTREGRLAVMSLLGAAGADLNAQDGRGFTVLHHAAVKGDEPMYFLLRGMGADAGHLSNEGKTALESGSPDFLRRVNARDLSENLMSAMSGEGSVLPAAKSAGFSL